MSLPLTTPGPGCCCTLHTTDVQCAALRARAEATAAGLVELERPRAHAMTCRFSDARARAVRAAGLVTWWPTELVLTRDDYRARLAPWGPPWVPVLHEALWTLERAHRARNILWSAAAVTGWTLGQLAGEADAATVDELRCLIDAVLAAQSARVSVTVCLPDELTSLVRRAYAADWPDRALAFAGPTAPEGA